MLVLAACTSRAECTSRADCAAAAAAVDCYTARCYCILLAVRNEHVVLLLAIHIPERLAAPCYLLWSFLTKYEMSRNVKFSPDV